MTNYVVDASSKIRANAIDAIGFGDLSPSLEKESNKTSTLLNPDIVEYKPFPLNSSHQTAEELHAIKLVQASIPDWHDGQQKTKLDKDFLSIYTDYLDDLNLKYDLNYIKKTVQDLVPAILQLKKKYNRARPIQVASYHGVKIFTEPTHTAKTPAYPSGHSFQAKVIEIILSKAHPDHINIFKSITDRISLARIIRGLHYPSDIQFSYFIVNKYLSKKL